MPSSAPTWPDADLAALYRSLPHVELHRHLIGGMRPGRLAALARRSDPTTHLRTAEDVQRWWAVDGLDAFIDRYIETIKLVRSCEDLEEIAADLAEDLAQEGIVYSEVTFLPARFVRTLGLPFDEVADAIRRGTERDGRPERVTVRFLIDLVREMETEVGLSMVEAGRRYLPGLVVGIDLGGREHRVPPVRFREVYARARSLGYGCVAHAGETVGPESIRSVVEDLQVDRVQHGGRCLEDPSLVRLLRERQVPLAVCPTSNVRLGVYPSHEAVPLRRLLDEGLCVSIHTDDAGFFDTSLEREFATMARAAQLSAADILRLHENAEHGRLDRRRPRSGASSHPSDGTIPA